jgi:hypothetical protein
MVTLVYRGHTVDMRDVKNLLSALTYDMMVSVKPI